MYRCLLCYHFFTLPVIGLCCTRKQTQWLSHCALATMQSSIELLRWPTYYNSTFFIKTFYISSVSEYRSQYCNSLVVYQLPRKLDVMVYNRVTLTHSVLPTKPLWELTVRAINERCQDFPLSYFPWGNHALQILCLCALELARLLTIIFTSQLVVHNFSQLVSQWMTYKTHREVTQLTNS